MHAVEWSRRVWCAQTAAMQDEVMGRKCQTFFFFPFNYHLFSLERIFSPFNFNERKRKKWNGLPKCEWEKQGAEAEIPILVERPARMSSRFLPLDWIPCSRRYAAGLRNRFLFWLSTDMLHIVSRQQLRFLFHSFSVSIFFFYFLVRLVRIAFDAVESCWTMRRAVTTILPHNGFFFQFASYLLCGIGILVAIFSGYNTFTREYAECFLFGRWVY